MGGAFALETVHVAPRYRKIYPHMWADAKVVSLSKPQPNAQTLWVHLLAGEQTEIIPGVCRIGEAAFAEQLGWSVEGLRKPFGELFRLGMVKVDWTARLVWVPNALRWNPPDNPNVVKSWREPWRHVPECELKHEIWQAFKIFLEPLGKGFAEGFAQGFPEPYAKPVISDQGAVNRDQDGSGSSPRAEIIEAASAEFELRAKLPKQPKAKRVAAAKPEPTDTAKVRRAFLDGYAARLPKAGAYPWGARENAQAERWLRSVPLPEALVMVAKFFEWSRPEVVRSGYPFGTGSNCLIMKYVELKGDMAHPERRAFAAVITDVEKQNDFRAQGMGQTERVLAAIAEERKQDARLGRTSTGAIRGPFDPPIGIGDRNAVQYPQQTLERRGAQALDQTTNAMDEDEEPMESA